MASTPARLPSSPVTPTGSVRIVRAPQSIVCVDCGGTCRPLAHPDEEFEPGDDVAYRCIDCWDRWDIIMEDADEDSE